VRRDLERFRGQIEVVVQRVCTDLLLSKDADRRLCVKRLLSLWNDCSITMLAKGNTTAKELVSLLLELIVVSTADADYRTTPCSEKRRHYIFAANFAKC